jgi:WD repeat-containing protein 45
VISILYKTQILALVGSSQNTKCTSDTVIMFDNYQNKKIGELYFKSSVRNVLIQKDKLIVVIDSGVLTSKLFG